MCHPNMPMTSSDTDIRTPIEICSSATPVYAHDDGCPVNFLSVNLTQAAVTLVRKILQICLQATNGGDFLD